MWRYGLFGVMLGAAGLPIYIHAPKYFVDTYGISLAALGVVMFLLRTLDLVQDPLLGRLISWIGARLSTLVSVGALSMALGMFGLFAVQAPIIPVLWFALTLSFVFSGYSLLSIAFYAQSADRFDAEQQVRVAKWRETGQLIGICFAALAPTVFGSFSDTPYANFAGAFAVLAGLGVFAMLHNWGNLHERQPELNMLSVARGAKAYLLLGFVNALPVAITSTLFLFFVEYRLDTPEMAGPLLVLFFLAAAVAAPIWSALAARFTIVLVLIWAMIATILSFAFALNLGSGDVYAFTLICLITGVTAGADMVLLPVFFTRFVKRNDLPAGVSFGLWSFAAKMALAFAALLVLPALDVMGFDPDALTAQGVQSLGYAYAGLPIILKLGAIWLLLHIGAKDARV